jgi:predicted nucleotide-binding protein (sugar kinase/HSP70/actin superfamily)
MDKVIARSTDVDELLADIGFGDAAVGTYEPAAAGRTGRQYIEAMNRRFTAFDRRATTILVAGLTVAQDMFLGAALRGLGYRIEVLDVPDNDALRLGKEFGNRGQCNPTYFTVGNLVKYLTCLRDEKGISVDDIRNNYVFLTAGACGPCRFGTYVTEYRKALRDAGFEGFRVLTASQTEGTRQAIGEGDGLRVTPRLFARVITALVVGDVLNALMYRIRPYEVIKGETDRVVGKCRRLLVEAFENNKSLVRALWRCRRRLARIRVDRTQVKPKVAIIGEFWAMTTEGDGNYQLQRFLESEGAEVDIQLITAWLLYLIWQGRWDTANRASLKQADGGRRGLRGVNVPLRFAKLWVAEKALLGLFHGVAAIMGLRGYHFPDQDELAALAHPYYDNDNRGGEGHMEVGKLIMNALHRKVNMTVSVKPFGCMPSSGVSDGVQSRITEEYPQAIFLPIETTGDGAVNVYSRVQMQLFKARQLAQQEFDEALARAGITLDTLREKLTRKSRKAGALHKSAHRVGCTAANLAYEIGRRPRTAR